MWETMHKVHCAIDWIDNPRGTVAQYGFRSFAGGLFANETETKHLLVVAGAANITLLTDDVGTQPKVN